MSLTPNGIIVYFSEAPKSLLMLYFDFAVTLLFNTRGYDTYQAQI